jgi:hypothetical protein
MRSGEFQSALSPRGVWPDGRRNRRLVVQHSLMSWEPSFASFVILSTTSLRVVVAPHP